MAQLSDDLRRLAYWFDRIRRDGLAQLSAAAAGDFSRLMHQAVDKAEALERGGPAAPAPTVVDLARQISIARGEEPGVVLLATWPRRERPAHPVGGCDGGSAA